MSEINNYKVYPYRWVVLITYMLSAFAIQLLWATFFSITTEAGQYYGYKDPAAGVNAISLLSVIFMIMAAGGAVHGHPDGSFAGAKSMRQAIDAAVQGIDLFEYAKTHKELAVMIDRLGGSAEKNFDLMK